MTSESINVWEPIRELCERFDLDPNWVRRIELRHDDAEVEVFKARDGQKYYDDEIGQVATEIVTFKIRTY